jgi:hypothetical protein
MKKKQDDTTRIPRQKAQLSIRKPTWMSQQEQQLATNDSTSPELVVADGSGVGLAIETASEVTVNSSEGPQQEQQLATNDSTSPELAVADGSGIGLEMETAAEVTINSSEGPQQEQQIATNDSISPEPTVADGSDIGLAMEFATNDHIDVLSVVEQQDKRDVIHAVSMFYGRTNSKCRPKPIHKASSLSEESGKETVTKKRRDL